MLAHLEVGQGNSQEDLRAQLGLEPGRVLDPHESSCPPCSSCISCLAGGGWSRSLQNPAAFPPSTWLLWSSPCTFLTLGMGDEAWPQLSR